MRNILLIFSLGIMLYCCKDSDNCIMDTNHKMAVYGRNLSTRSSIDSIEMVLKYAYKVIWNPHDGTIPALCMGTEDQYYDGGGCQRDFENRRFLFSGEWVIMTGFQDIEPQLGWLITGGHDVLFIGGRDTTTGELLDVQKWENIIVLRCVEDTIGYIPNAVMSSACERIIEAYNKKDYATCYGVFDTAFVFVPTTGAKWKALKEAGIE